MFDANFFRNPYPVYQKLRDAAPIHFSDKFGWDGAWLVTRHDGVARVYNDPNLSAVRGHRFFDQYSPEVKEQLRDFARMFEQWVVFLDPPEHGLWRKAMMAGFTATRVKQMEPLIVESIDGLLDSLEDKETPEFIHDFCFPLPATVVGTLMGIRSQDNEGFILSVNDIAAFFGNPGASVEAGRKAQVGMFTLRKYFQELIAERVESPRDDVISLMIDVLRASEQSRAECDRMIEEELPTQCTGLIFAGLETTGNLIGNGLYALFNQPDQLDLLIRNPAVAAGVARETARYDTPGQFSTRIAAHQCEFLGQTLQGGQLVIGLVGSANRDERVFADPNVFKIERSDGGNMLAFGNGRHYCLGSHLAIFETALAFERLIRRYPKIRPAAQSVEWTHNVNLRGLRALPVHLH